jgi:hypothetical protein
MDISRGNSGLPIHQVVEGLALNAKALRRFLNGDADRLDALLPDNPARCGGFFMVIVSGLLMMMVDQIKVAERARIS